MSVKDKDENTVIRAVLALSTEQECDSKGIRDMSRAVRRFTVLCRSRRPSVDVRVFLAESFGELERYITDCDVLYIGRVVGDTKMPRRFLVRLSSEFGIKVVPVFNRNDSRDLDWIRSLFEVGIYDGIAWEDFDGTAMFRSLFSNGRNHSDAMEYYSCNGSEYDDLMGAAPEMTGAVVSMRIDNKKKAILGLPPSFRNGWAKVTVQSI